MREREKVDNLCEQDPSEQDPSDQARARQLTHEASLDDTGRFEGQEGQSVASYGRQSRIPTE